MARSWSREKLGIGLLSASSAIAVVLAAAAVVNVFSDWSGFRAFETPAIDLAFRAERALSGADADSAIVIIDIDNQSLERYQQDLGRWPWPRNTHAAILEFVSLGAPRSVAFDILFSEPDLARPGADSVFVAAHASSPRTVHAVFFRERGGEVVTEPDGGALTRFALPSSVNAIDLSEYAAADRPFDTLDTAATAVGGITRTPDPDGVSRREPVVFRHQGRVYPSLGLAIALGGPGGYGRVSPRDGNLAVDDRVIPLADGKTTLRWRGGYADHVYPVIPAHVVLNSYVQISIGDTPDIDPAVFNGRDVIIGSSAAGVSDLFPTPFGPTEPGVLVHATLLDTIRSGDMLHPLGIGLSTLYFALVTLIAALLLAFVKGPVRFGAALLAILATIGAVALIAFTVWDRIIPAALPALGTLIASSLTMGGNYLVEGRRHREIKGAFGKFIPPGVVEMIADAQDDLYRQSVRREITVMFCDVRGFTTLSERRDPDDVVAQLNTFLGAMVESVFNHGGTLDKYLGDGLMAFFGAPVEDRDHAATACASALEMLERLGDLNERWQAEDRPMLAVGIGIHTGEAVVGFVGDPERRMDYTAIGDTVNLASRLEGVTKSEGVPIVISGATVARLKGRFGTRLLGTRTVKGKSEPVEVHALETAGRGS